MFTMAVLSGAKAAQVASLQHGRLQVEESSWFVSNIYVSLYFVSRSQGSRSSMVFGVGRKISLLTMSSVIVPALVVKVGGDTSNCFLKLEKKQ